MVKYQATLNPIESIDQLRAEDPFEPEPCFKGKGFSFVKPQHPAVSHLMGAR